MKLFLLQFGVFLFISTNAFAENDIAKDVDVLPTITTQPLSQLECEGNSVRFKVLATGSGLTYTWQRKRPTDLVFLTIVDEENIIEGASTNEIKISNVGSARFPHGTQFQVVVSDGSSSVISNAATLTVNEITNVTGGTNVTQCFGTNYSYTVTTSYPANVVSYRWKKSVTSGVWDEISDSAIYSGTTTATLSITGGTPAESGEYRAYVAFKSSGTDCSVVSTTRTRKITFLPQLTTPVTTITQPTCLTPSGTITVTVQSTTDTYSFDNGANYQSSNVKSGLGAGFYNVIIKNSVGCLSAVTNSEVVSETSRWNGTWVNGLPDANRGVVFEQNFSSTNNLEACSCQVINHANVTINGIHTLKITNAVDVVSGSLTFENNASLVQVNENPSINSGNIIYKRQTSPLNRYDFTYWSSPVAAMTLEELSPATFFDKYFSYNNVWVSVPRSTVMNNAEGYSVRAPQTTEISGNPLPYLAIFEGVPNNGLITLTSLTGNQAHLLGNPYPSAMDADIFIDLNSSVLEGTLYFWTHNSPPSLAISGDKNYNYTTADYATYNRTGGVGVGYHAGTDGIIKKIPTGNIAAGQGFFAPLKSTGNVVFNNTMRILGGVSGIDNSQFFKFSTNPKTTIAKTEKNRIWLNLTNSEGAFKQTLVGYITGATNDYDGAFDGVTYNGNVFVDFYSVNNDVNLAIQGRALPFVKKDSVALGYRTTIIGDFQISIDQTDGVLGNQNVFLEDKDLKVLHDLKKEAYTFSTEKGTFNNRFVLRYLNENSLEKRIEEKMLGENIPVLVSVGNRKIKINSSNELINTITIYNVLGKKVYQKEKIGVSSFVIQNLNIAPQILFVQLVLENEKTVTKKIIY